MRPSELHDVLGRYPELRAGVPRHLGEVMRIAARILEMERVAYQPPELPDDAPEWERDWWASRSRPTPALFASPAQPAAWDGNFIAGVEA